MGEDLDGTRRSRVGAAGGSHALVVLGRAGAHWSDQIRHQCQCWVYPYNDETLIEFLSEFDETEQRPVLLIWDGLPSHRSRRMSNWIASQRHWLLVEPLPGYAPDINPIEHVWGNLKSTELANLCSDTIGEVADIAEGGLDRIGSAAAICMAFLRHTGLRL